ncbi:MAG TPA: PQQ-binding-like beta-propeller repeat protein [Urbifossiella sp.]|nr:PQQ-binding-like beta-propeller repeat protein [Urbifossiella sp.]
MAAPRIALALALALTPALVAADWPQWRGPTGDGVAAGFTAPAAWPKELKKGWSVAVGQGVATPALAGGKLYAFGFEDGQEVLRCLDAATGKELWKEGYTTPPVTGFAGGYPAARSSPAVAAGKVVTFGVQGVLSCLDAATGKVQWRKDNTGPVPMFSTSCSPLIAGGLCVVQVGGDGRGAVVAFDLGTGAERWRWASDGTKYASPTVVDVGGLKAVVAETTGTVSAVGLADGKVLWQASFSSKYNASTPVAAGPVVMYGGTGKANTAVKLERKGNSVEAVKLWANDENPVQFGSPAVANGRLFNIAQDGTVFCIDTATGKTVWTGRPSAGGTAPPPAGKFKGKGGGGGGYGAVVVAGSALFTLTPSGQLVVLDAAAAEYKELAKYRVADGGTYAYPVVDGNRVFVRDRDSVTLWTIE